jgi:mannosidase alpha-like ER degradation enhancer 2
MQYGCRVWALSLWITVATPTVFATESALTGVDAKEARQLATQVRQEFLHAWRNYERYAWGHDELQPLSKTPRDWYGQSLLMTPVDALDTLILMGLKDEADKTRKLIDTQLSFDRDVYVKNFEITIRMLGGLLSAYELSGDNRLLVLAQDLGKRLLPAFDSPTGLPYQYVNLHTGKVRGAATNPAETGSLLLEFGTLSKLTGERVYFDKAKRALMETHKRRSDIGLVGDGIDVETGKWISTDSHISGGIDSYYEYLWKCWKLFGDRDCLDMWNDSIVAVNKYLADSANGELLDRARRLQDSSFKMWNLYGVEPEVLDYRSKKVEDPRYALRPEIVESTYYLYRLTGQPLYRSMGRSLFASFVKYCRTSNGYAALQSIITKEQKNEMQSFVFAETFKYFYLLFAPPATLDFDRIVFNTEAHPLRRIVAERHPQPGDQN